MTFVQRMIYAPHELSHTEVFRGVWRVTPDYAQQILSNNHLYGDGPPKWLQGKYPKVCKTANQAEEESLRLVKRLHKYCHDDKEVRGLAQRLIGCRDGARCHSGACPRCSRAFQRWAVVQERNLVRRSGLSPERGELMLVSMIPTSSSGARSSTSRPDKAHRRIGKALRLAGIRWAVGGLDFSLNESPTESRDGVAGIRERLAVHGWFLTPAMELRSNRKLLREAVPAFGSVKRPIVATTWDGSLQALAYGHKGDYVRRETLPKVYDDSGQTVTRRNTRDRPLRVHQTLRLMLELDRLGLIGRMILHGASIEPGRDGPTLQLT